MTATSIPGYSQNRSKRRDSSASHSTSKSHQQMQNSQDEAKSARKSNENPGALSGAQTGISGTRDSAAYNTGSSTSDNVNKSDNATGGSVNPRDGQDNGNNSTMTGEASGAATGISGSSSKPEGQYKSDRLNTNPKKAQIRKQSSKKSIPRRRKN